MKICGVISEYNPFHSGHHYHLENTKEKTGCDYIICISSGCFTQRGEPTIFDKWQRAKAAIMCGADMVLELPTYFATSSAENFAFGAVKIFDKLGVDYLSFGSEVDDVAKLTKVAQILVDEPEGYKKILKEKLANGISFPMARKQALIEFENDEGLKNIVSGSNSILAIEYIKSIIKLGSKIEPKITKRKGSEYNEENITHELSSATAIRNHFFDNGFDDKIASNMPSKAVEVFNASLKQGFCPTHKEDFFDSIMYAIRKYSKAELAQISDVSEGLENRIKKVAGAAKNYDELAGGIKSKRFTYTRIQRILIHILLGITKDDIERSKVDPINNVKVLAYKKQSKVLMSQLYKNSDINLFHSAVGLDDDFFVSKDITATDIYSLNQKEEKFYKSNRDFTSKTQTD